jgi:hypothetical protein
MKIKLFSDLKLIDNYLMGYIHPLVYELLNNESSLHNYYKFVEVENADYGIFPICIEKAIDEKQSIFKDFLQVCKNLNLKTLVFSTGDFGVTLAQKHTITLRLGGFKSRFKHRTDIMCPFIEDPIIKYNYEFFALPKSEKVTVGFVGHANNKFSKIIKELMIYSKHQIKRFLKLDPTDFQSFYPSSFYRYKYLKLIQTFKSIETNFIFRKKYRAGSVNESDRKITEIEFYQNIFSNSYTFCMRGSGNFSVRFYETLAMGRIPILLDTDCQLPFDEEINWHKHVVIINKNDLHKIEQIINTFHYQLNHEEFLALQKSNRQLWLDYFRKEQFFIHYFKLLT